LVCCADARLTTLMPATHTSAIPAAATTSGFENLMLIPPYTVRLLIKDCTPDWLRARQGACPYRRDRREPTQDGRPPSRRGKTGELLYSRPVPERGGSGTGLQ